MLFPVGVLVMVLWAFGGSAIFAGESVHYYVALDGNDAWSGTLPAPNRNKTDGPFATAARAQQAVRDARAKARGAITIHIRGGIYFLELPLVFMPEDSGAADAPIVWTGYRDERPVISGGARLTGWRRDGTVWRLTLPEVAGGEWNFIQLFVNGERRYRPRLPKKGYYFIAGDLPPSAANKTKGHDRFRFAESNVRADWKNLNDVEILAFQLWTMARLRVASVDEKTRTVTFTGPTHGLEYYQSLQQGWRYLVENVSEALSEGEWVLDRTTGELTYWPKPGERMDRAEIIAPRLPRLLQLRGNPMRKQWVEHLTFRNITFSHTNWITPREGNAYPQAEVNLAGAITATGARHVAWENCAVQHIGTYAIEWGAGCKYNRLENCELTDLGAGGVKIGETTIRDNEETVASHNVVRNCLIAHGGRLHPAAVGVWIGQSHHNQIEHNEIHDFYYTGVSVGWTWGYGRSLAHQNTVAFNNIHQIGQGVLSDMGGIYTLGVSPGSALRHNRIYDVESYDYGGWGIYPDEGTSELLIENNIVYRTKTGGFHQHYGRKNIVRNNIFAFGRQQQLQRSRPEPHRSFDFVNNIVYWRQGPLLGSNWNDDQYFFDRNVYWLTNGQPITFAQWSWEQWRVRGQDRNSVIADPRFVAPEQDDFRLRADSPALALGFQPIDNSKIGRQTQTAPKTVAMQRAFPPPIPPPPRAIDEDFESYTVGEKCRNAITSEENQQAVIRVTDETAQSGRHSLKFTDGPNQKHDFNPHLYFQPNFTAGLLRGAFALRLGKGARFFHEWRDHASPYRVGPSLIIETDGALLARGQRLVTLPHNQWIRFEITCGLGNQAKGSYDLAVQLPDLPPLRFENLFCDPHFKDLQWIGFVSLGSDPTVFYLDDIVLKPQ